MKIIHTADVHLDMCFAGAGMTAAFGNRRRQSLRDSFRAIAARAGAWPADAFLIAGDLFEGDRVSRDTIAFLISEFAAIPHVPVFIAPGNHDPYTAQSPYAVEAWPPNVTIFAEPRWRAIALHDGRLTVHGFGFDGPDISSNPFGTLCIDGPAKGVHVAVAHGSERGHQPAEKEAYAPFDARDAALEGLRYLALGHFHALGEIIGPFATRMYYSGSPEGHSFREPGMRHYLEIEIADAESTVRPVPSSRMVYSPHTIACEEFSSSQDLIDTIRATLAGTERPQIVRLTLTGSCNPDIRAEFAAVRDSLAARYEYLEFLDKTTPVEDFDELAREETGLGAFVLALNRELGDTTEDARKRLLERAREVGVAAFRSRDLEIRGLDRG